MRKISQKENLENSNGLVQEGSWAISYSDMLTLLVAFLILFFSVDPVKSERESLRRSLLAVFEPEPIGSGEQDEKFDKSLQEEDFTYLGISVKEIGKRIVVEFPDVSFFNSGETELLPQGLEKIALFAQKFVPFAGKTVVNVIGFTDDRPVKRNRYRYRDNLELSALRAISAQRALSKYGIPIDRTRIGGHGIKGFLTAIHEKNKKIKNIEDDQQDINLLRAVARSVVLVVEPEEHL